MKVAEAEMPSKNKIVNRKGTEGPERFQKIEEDKKKLNLVEEWILAEDRWCRGASGQRPFTAIFIDRGSEKSVKRKSWNILTPQGEGAETLETDRRG
jgi:hypothetical protein